MKTNIIIVLLVLNTMMMSLFLWNSFYKEPKNEERCLQMAQNFENLRLNDKSLNQDSVDHVSLFMKNYLNCVADR